MDVEVWVRMQRWLDADEGRTITLFGANPDFEGPEHIMEFSTFYNEPCRVTGKSRAECMDKIQSIER